MSIVKKCDACGDVYDLPEIRAENYKEHPNGIKLLCFYGANAYYSHKALDLCPNCMCKIQNVLNNKEQQYGKTD